MRLNPYNLVFAGEQSHLEPEYRSAFFKKTLGHLRFVQFAAIFFLASWTYIDFLIYPDQTLPFGVIKLVLVAAFGLGLLLSLLPLYEDLYPVAAVGLVVLVGAGFCLMIVLESSENVYPLVFGISFTYIFNYAFIRQRFLWATVSGWILFGILVVSLHLVRLDVRPEISNGILYYVAVLNLLGMIIAYTIERSSRHEFFLTSELTRERDWQAALSNELKESIEEIKTLRGILPICSNCKKVRDDDGYWQRVDVYLQEHTEAQLSHDLCSGCLEELYPDLSRNEGLPEGTG